MTTVPVIDAGTAGSTSAVTSTNSHSVSLAYPSGIKAGDVLLLFGANSDGGTLFSVPSGFSGDYNIRYIPKLSQSNSSGNDLDVIAASKIATGTESGNLTVSWGSSNVSTGGAVMVRVTGVATTGAIVSSANTLTPQGTTVFSTSPSPLNVTSPGAQDLVVRAYMYGQDNSATTGAIGSPSGWTNLQNIASTASTGSGLFNMGISVNYLQAGISSPSVSSSTGKGAWMVVDYDIQGLPSASASSNYNVTMRRANIF